MSEVQISENEAIGRLTHLRGMLMNQDPKMGAALKLAIDKLVGIPDSAGGLWERTSAALQGNPKALERLNTIMNRTGQSEDGERLYVSLVDLAEVYTILFMAWSAGPEMMGDLMQYADDEKDGRAITDVRLFKGNAKNDDRVDLEAATAETPVADLIVVTDWT